MILHWISPVDVHTWPALFVIRTLGGGGGGGGTPSVWRCRRVRGGGGGGGGMPSVWRIQRPSFLLSSFQLLSMMNEIQLLS